MCKSCPVVDWAEGLPSAEASGVRKVNDSMGEAHHVVWYDRYEPAQKAIVGGKNASLGELMAVGLPVPPGFAVTTTAYERIWHHDGLPEAVNALLEQIDHGAHGANRKVANEIRR